MSQAPTLSQASAPSLVDRLHCEVMLKGLVDHGGQLSEVSGDITAQVWVKQFGALMVRCPLLLRSVGRSADRQEFLY